MDKFILLLAVLIVTWGARDQGKEENELAKPELINTEVIKPGNNISIQPGELTWAYELDAIINN